MITNAFQRIYNAGTFRSPFDEAAFATRTPDRLMTPWELLSLSRERPVRLAVFDATQEARAEVWNG